MAAEIFCSYSGSAVRPLMDGIIQAGNVGVQLTVIIVYIARRGRPNELFAL
ncbi:19706_t:CDS:2 [Gigaspora margarita]|uniref:19706_t:CDS:1 n=1 Tax=Gigaspora margarita TaxID=4874 RepID=A0ABM8W572_GIGMA|nr:19706_t:CDS:2 [Gigaspora margarita]